jgi:hypothetical protein
MLNTRTSAIVAVALVTACRQPVSVAPAPGGTSIASFTAVSPHNHEAPPRNQCWVAGELDGNAILRDGTLSLAVSRGWIAVTRDNDKEWDDLHLAVEVSVHPFSEQRWMPLGTSIPVVLRPTVDSAGPQLTTWQSSDTLRLFVPWKQAIGPRWLVFTLDYQTLSHAGQHSSCRGRLGTDTLRFRPG